MWACVVYFISHIKQELYPKACEATVERTQALALDISGCKSYNLGQTELNLFEHGLS